MFKALLLTMALTEGADCVSTHVALSRPGIHETVLTQNPWVNDSLIAARATGEQVSLRKLHATHPRWAIAIAAGVVAGNGYVVVSNLRVMHQQSYLRK